MRPAPKTRFIQSSQWPDLIIDSWGWIWTCDDQGRWKRSDGAFHVYEIRPDGTLEINQKAACLVPPPTMKGWMVTTWPSKALPHVVVAEGFDCVVDAIDWTATHLR